MTRENFTKYCFSQHEVLTKKAFLRKKLLKKNTRFIDHLFKLLINCDEIFVNVRDQLNIIMKKHYVIEFKLKTFFLNRLLILKSYSIWHRLYDDSCERIINNYKEKLSMRIKIFICVLVHISILRWLNLCAKSSRDEIVIIITCCYNY